MRLSKPALRSLWPITGRVAAAGLFLAAAFAVSAFAFLNDERKLTVSTNHVSFSVSILDRQGREYVDIVEVLNKIGHTAAASSGSDFTLRFENTEGQFRQASTEGGIGHSSVQLAGAFLIENGRGLVPPHSVLDVLAQFVKAPAEYREKSQHVFLDDSGPHFNPDIRRGPPSMLVLKFSERVNPRISAEGSKLRLSFHDDPIALPARTWNFDDPLISTVTYNKNESGSELVISGSEPLLATFSDSGKTINITAAPKFSGMQPAPQPSAQTPAAPTASSPTSAAPESTGTNTPAASASGTASVASPSNIPHAHFLILLDASHGGEERGAALTEELAEKDVTLAIARRLHAELQNRGFTSFMIRDSDTTISLDQRAAAANAARAAVYVAIHAGRLGHGVRIYTSMLAPTDAQPGTFLPWETAQAGYVRASRIVASSMLDELAKNPARISVAMLPAPVRPLNNIAGPALAVEIAPQRNEVESLSNPNYQQSIAASLAAAIAAARPRLEERR